MLRAAAAAGAVVASLLVVPLNAVAATDQLVVDLGTSTGAVHGGAAGSLYGVYGEGLPSRNLLEGMNLQTVSTKAQDGPQHPGADALEMVTPFADTGGKDVYIYMTDIYRGFPYEWPGSNGAERLADYKAKITKQVQQVLTTGDYQDHIVFVPFNEPEGNMFGTGSWSYDNVSWRTDPAAFFAAWKDVYLLIKGLAPDARIAGPNTSALYDQIQGFLAYAKANNVVPDVMTWHELSSPSSVRTNVAKYRGWEKAVGIGPLPINVNEYGYNYHLSVPGQVIQWVSAIEDSKIDADLAYWNIDGNLNDSAVEANRANGQWWLFNAYGQMTGNTVKVTAPHPNVQYTLQGVASLDTARRQSRILLGGQSGSADVVVDNVSASVFGGTVHATVQEIPWTGQVGDSAQPLRLQDTELPVSSGRVTIPLTGLNAMSAYQVILSPGGNGTKPAAPSVSWRQSYEAEAAGYTGGGYSKNGPEGSPSNVAKFATSGGYDVGGLRTGSDGVLSFSVTVPTTGTYDLSVFANSYNLYGLVQSQGPTNVFLRVDGASPQELRLPLGYKWVVWGHTDTQVQLTAGTHTLTLAAQDATLGSTKGDAIIDKIDLALHDAAVSAPAIYEAEYATLTAGAHPVYTVANASGAGVTELARDETATFWIHSPTDGPATISTDHFGGGKARLGLNGESVARPLVGGTTAGTNSMTVFLSAGINKVTLRGTTGNLRLDRLRVTPAAGALATTVYQAEDGTLGGAAKATTDFTFAAGGRSVTAVGDGAANSLKVNVTAAKAGRYALTIRYSNGEQAPATHYNPDPVARHADLSVNGATTQRVLFPTTFHFNAFKDLTVPVTLKQGSNTLTFTADELPDFDGTTYNAFQQRSAFAPVFDQFAVTPLTTL
ncbi:cellulosome protein [Kitasatospora sp. CMC57]|uniref:cellulosome protein n=1 Tax=Kitasatospora sp. CMC57 TaxID=3231513 RepID=UPI0038B4B71C